MNAQLDSGVILVERQQMTMDVHESQHTLDRINRLRHAIRERRGQLVGRDDAARGVHALFDQTESLVTAFSERVAQTSLVAEDAKEDELPTRTEWDRVEAEQLALESALTPAAVALQVGVGDSSKIVQIQPAIAACSLV